ncbi:MAG: terminase small subunit [Lactobacillales bacterium]|nr:terminase small subunit [Lactobacillales bacterium]
MTLTVKQKEFLHAYLKNGNATKTYQAIYGGEANAGASSASRLLAREDAQVYLSEIEKKSDQELHQIYSKKESFDYLCHVQAAAFDITPKPDFTAILKAEELKGKLTGLYEKDKTGTEDTPADPIEVIIKS